MAEFGKKSKELLSQCHPDLQTVFNKVVEYFDCSVICGYRGEQEQNSAYNNNFSKVKYPNSKHNQKPSLAVDVVPYPINWSDVNRMRFFAGHVVMTGEMLYEQGEISHRIRWGGDWDMDTEVNDQRFNDFPHFEII